MTTKKSKTKMKKISKKEPEKIEETKETIKKKEYYDRKGYRIFMDFFTVFSAITGIYLTLLMRGDTKELTKTSDKPLYYDINLYTTEDSRNNVEMYEKYIRMNLKLVVDDFEIKKKNSFDINYNATITKKIFFMVYDYDLSKNDFKYMNYRIHDKTQSQLTYDDNLHTALTTMNYSFTPNKEFCYILIYTETLSQKNLDLIFFKFYDQEDYISLDTTFNENNQELVNISRIDYDTFLCKDYYIDLWSEEDSKKANDLKFLFQVYEDLRNKKIS